LAYKDWCRVQDLCKGKTLTKEDVVEIESIKAQFNSKRKLFDFSHFFFLSPPPSPLGGLGGGVNDERKCGGS